MAGGGVQINYVPRDGGNTYKGLLFYSFANGAMQGTNYSNGTRDAATGAARRPTASSAAASPRSRAR
jgi:hypothetical protein